MTAFEHPPQDDNDLVNQSYVSNNKMRNWHKNCFNKQSK